MQLQSNVLKTRFSTSLLFFITLFTLFFTTICFGLCVCFLLASTSLPFCLSEKKTPNFTLYSIEEMFLNLRDFPKKFCSSFAFRLFPVFKFITVYSSSWMLALAWRVFRCTPTSWLQFYPKQFFLKCMTKEIGAFEFWNRLFHPCQSAGDMGISTSPQSYSTSRQPPP